MASSIGPRTPDLIEDAAGRLCEAVAVLDVIEEWEMLAELPTDPAARKRHQNAVSLLAILRRELIVLSRDLQATQQVEDAIARATARDKR